VTATDTSTPTATTTPAQPAVTYQSCNQVAVDGGTYGTVYVARVDREAVEYDTGYRGRQTFSVTGVISEVIVYYAGGSVAVRNPEVSACQGDIDGEEPTPTETESAAIENQAVLDVQSLVEDAVARYIAIGRPGGGLLDVTAANSVDGAEIREPLYDARDRISDAEDQNLSNAEETLLSHLKGARWCPWYLEPTQEALRTTHRRAANAWDRAIGGDWTAVRSRAESVPEDAADVRPQLEKVTDNSDPADVAVLADRSAEEYEDKIDQIETAVDEYAELGPLLLSVADAVGTFATAAREYRTDEYQDASATFLTARQNFEDAGDTADSADWSGPRAQIVEGVTELTAAAAEGCRLYDQAAQAGADWEQDRRESLASDADDALSGWEGGRDALPRT
jgi:hypothetical protein